MILHLICMLFAITLSFSFHEYMHARVAVWLGDETPANMGRLTMNPLAHMDIMGVILILVAGIGWGKPVMYNPSRLDRFKSARLMNIMVHLAGVTGNLIIALIASVFAGVLAALSTRFDHIIILALYLLMAYTISFSLMLLAFNLLPIPPLDGFHVLEELLPYKVKSSDGYMKFQRISPMILWGVFLLSALGRIPILSVVISFIEFPFSFLCDLVQTLFSWLVSFLL